MKTQVAIIGAGPAGLLLSALLARRGVHSVVLERQSRGHVLSRIRAGVLESTTVDVLRANGLADRMDREGQAHDGMRIVWAGRDSFLIDTHKVLGRRFMTYGQTQIQEDLFADADRRCASATRARPKRSTASSSPAATASTACRARPCRRACCASSRRSIPSAGWA